MQEQKDQQYQEPLEQQKILEGSASDSDLAGASDAGSDAGASEGILLRWNSARMQCGTNAARERRAAQRGSKTELSILIHGSERCCSHLGGAEARRRAEIAQWLGSSKMRKSLAQS